MNFTKYKLKDICVKITDGSHYSPEACESGYPMFSVKDMGDYNFIYDDVKYISKSDFSLMLANDCVPQKDDVLIAKDGSYLTRVFVCEETKNEAILSSIAIFRCNKEIVNPKFLAYLFKTPYVKNYTTKSCVSGSALPRIVLKAFSQLELFIPSLEEQKKIVSILSPLDRKISLNRSINAELERMAKEIYDYWFVQFDFPDEHGRPYKSSGGAMVYNPVLKREVPEGWEVKELSKICKTKLGGTPDTSREEFWNGEFQWFNSGEVAEFPIVESEKSITQEGIDGSATSFLKAGSITLSITRHLRPSILAIDACINQSVVGIEENDIFKKSFIYPYLSREIPRLMTLRVGAQQPHINKETIDVSSIVIPPNEILKKYYETVDDIYEAIINNALQNKKLTSLRDKLLPLLMTGQVKIK